MTDYLDYKFKNLDKLILNLDEKDFLFFIQFLRELKNSITIIYTNNELFGQYLYRQISSLNLDKMSIRLTNYIGYHSNRIFFMFGSYSIEEQLKRFEIMYDDSKIKYIITDELNTKFNYNKIVFHKDGINLNYDYKKYIRYKKIKNF